MTDTHGIPNQARSDSPRGTIEVIPAYLLRNIATGEKISRFSALPYGKACEWEKIPTGFTWGITDRSGSYTEGLGRKPAPTRADAEGIAKRYSQVTGATLITNQA